MDTDFPAELLVVNGEGAVMLVPVLVLSTTLEKEKLDVMPVAVELGAVALELKS